MNTNKLDRLTKKLGTELIRSGLKPHVQLLAKNFASAMADQHDLPSNEQNFSVLRTVFQSVHDNSDRHTALRTLIQMIDAIDANPDKLISSVARKLAVAHFETTLKQQEPFPPERELAMGVQLFKRVATNKYTKLAIANHVQDTAQRVAADLPEQLTAALETIREFLKNPEVEQPEEVTEQPTNATAQPAKGPVIIIRARRKFIRPESVPA